MEDSSEYKDCNVTAPFEPPGEIAAVAGKPTTEVNPQGPAPTRAVAAVAGKPTTEVKAQGSAPTRAVAAVAGKPTCLLYTSPSPRD